MGEHTGGQLQFLVCGFPFGNILGDAEIADDLTRGGVNLRHHQCYGQVRAILAHISPFVAILSFGIELGDEYVESGNWATQLRA